jgi:hypothetical protein
MAKYYVFHGTTGTAVMVTDDKTGAKLPKHPVGSWVYSREVELNRGEQGTIGASSDEVIDAISRDGYFRWPQSGP